MDDEKKTGMNGEPETGIFDEPGTYETSESGTYEAPDTGMYADPNAGFYDEPIVISDTSALNQSEPKKETKKSLSVGTIIAVAFIVLALCVAGFFGIQTLSRKGNITEQDGVQGFTLEQGKWTKFQAYYAMPILGWEHTVNYIPTAREYYFVVFSVDFKSMAVIRADKSWCDDYFSEGYAIDEEGVTVEGYVRKTDTDVTRELDSEISEFQVEFGRSFKVDTGLYIDLIATRVSIYEIIIMAIPLLCVILFLTVGRKFKDMPMNSSPAKYILVALLIGGLAYGVFVIHALEFVM